MRLFPSSEAAPCSLVAGEQRALLHSPEWLSGSMWVANGKRVREDFAFFCDVCTDVFILYHL